MIPNKKLLNFKCITWQDKQIQQQNKNTLSYVFLSPCHLITISSIEHKNRPITGKNLRLALKYGTLHKDTHLLLLLILSRQCLLADEILFTPSSAKWKKKSKYFKKHNSRTQSKHMKQAWSAGKRGWPWRDLFQLFIWLVEKMALFFFSQIAVK